MADADRCRSCGIELESDSSAELCPRCLAKRTTDGGQPIAAGRVAADPTGDWSSNPPEQRSTDYDFPSKPDESTAGPGETEGVQAQTRTFQTQHQRSARGALIRYFGDYEILNELGRGGMGVVYKVRQISLNRTVALKLIKAGVLADDAEMKRFQNEAESVALLDHPGIVPIYEVGEHESQRYFSMKLVEGGNLDDQLDSFTNNPRAAATLLAEVAEGVHHAHMRGILHRDLKPANILVDTEGHPHVTDFGLAKRVEGDGEMTASGAILGTPAYMSPEQATGRRGAITTATDVYGLGAVLYALLAGQAPFGGGSIIDTLDAVRMHPPRPPTRINSKAPRDLETICLKCLEKDPRRRYTSAQALADDLKAWLESRPIAARRVSAVERAWLWCKRRPMEAALSAVVLFSLIGGTAAVLVVQSRANTRLAATNKQLKLTNQALEDERQRVEVRENQAVQAVRRFAMRSPRSPR